MSLQCADYLCTAKREKEKYTADNSDEVSTPECSPVKAEKEVPRSKLLDPTARKSVSHHPSESIPLDAMPSDGKKPWGDCSNSSMQLESVRSDCPQDGSSGEFGWRNAQPPRVPYSTEPAQAKLTEAPSSRDERGDSIGSMGSADIMPTVHADVKVKEQGRIAEV
jgi:hypothetical protein